MGGLRSSTPFVFLRRRCLVPRAVDFLFLLSAAMPLSGRYRGARPPCLRSWCRACRRASVALFPTELLSIDATDVSSSTCVPYSKASRSQQTGPRRPWRRLSETALSSWPAVVRGPTSRHRSGQKLGLATLRPALDQEFVRAPGSRFLLGPKAVWPAVSLAVNPPRALSWTTGEGVWASVPKSLHVPPWRWTHALSARLDLDLRCRGGRLQKMAPSAPLTTRASPPLLSR
jgi:hypothetical protein